MATAGPPHDSFRLVTAQSRRFSTGALVALVVGVILAFSGLALLGVAAIVAQGVSSANQACAQIPNCTPESDPSGALAVGGVIVLVIGILLAVYGYLDRSG